jgi:hypothetical protein
MSALSPQVDPAATVELVELIRQQLHRLIKEHDCGATTQPSVIYQLEGALGSLLRDLRNRPTPIRRALDGEAVAWVRWFVEVGRRQDMTDAFHRLNPTFGVQVDHRYDCWSDSPERRACRTAARRREQALSLGDRIADLLDPSETEGGEAA